MFRLCEVCILETVSQSGGAGFLLLFVLNYSLRLTKLYSLNANLIFGDSPASFEEV